MVENIRKMSIKRKLRHIVTAALLAALTCALCGCGKTGTDTVDLNAIDLIPDITEEDDNATSAREDIGELQSEYDESEDDMTVSVDDWREYEDDSGGQTVGGEYSGEKTINDEYSGDEDHSGEASSGDSEGDSGGADDDGEGVTVPPKVNQETQDEIDRILSGDASYEADTVRSPGNIAR